MDAPARVALYGGSFNPPHLGHQFVALYALECLPLDALWLLPVADHPFAKALAPFELRCAWCEALLAPLGPRAEVCRIERELPAPSYTLDTLTALGTRYPKTQFSLIFGTDIRAESARWKHFAQIERDYPIHWIGRLGHGEEGQGLILPDISSKEVRRRLSAALDASELVPRRVLAAIQESGYRFA